MHILRSKFPGLALTIALALVVVVTKNYVSLNGSLVAIVLGFLVGNLMSVSEPYQAGIKWTESKGLAVAVALLGVQLNLDVLLQLNTMSLAIIAFSLVLTFFVTVLIAQLMKVGAAESCLVASGQAICGSAAVMAAAKVIDSNKHNQVNKQSAAHPDGSSLPTGLIIAVVNFLGFIGVFITPWLVTEFFRGDDLDAGLMIGNTLQSMGHVVAAGFSVNEAVGQNAVLIKMCRILFLIPTLMVLIFWFTKKAKAQNQTHGDSHKLKENQVNFNWFKMIPMFIWGFLLLIVLNNFGLINDQISGLLQQIGDGLFILAMVAIGLNIKLKDIWQQGGKLLLLAALLFTLQMVFTVTALMLL